ncbi:MAG: hypothetical protein Q4P29_08260, partial [Tissierellia bacterium]|nr:hypothetical protein [Tissierellia bacterium]
MENKKANFNYSIIGTIGTILSIFQTIPHILNKVFTNNIINLASAYYNIPKKYFKSVKFDAFEVAVRLFIPLILVFLPLIYGNIEKKIKAKKNFTKSDKILNNVLKVSMIFTGFYLGVVNYLFITNIINKYDIVILIINCIVPIFYYYIVLYYDF